MNPRQERVLLALLTGPKSREEVDRIAGASNGPEVIRQLRATGLSIPMKRVTREDRDGRQSRPGIYSLTTKDAARVRETFVREGQS